MPMMYQEELIESEMRKRMQSDNLMREMKRMEKKKLAKVCSYAVPRLDRTQTPSIEPQKLPEDSPSRLSSDTALITLRTSSLERKSKLRTHSRDIRPESLLRIQGLMEKNIKMSV